MGKKIRFGIKLILKFTLTFTKMSVEIVELNWELCGTFYKDLICNLYGVRRKMDSESIYYTVNKESKETYIIYYDDENRPKYTEIMTFLNGKLKKITFYRDWAEDEQTISIKDGNITSIVLRDKKYWSFHKFDMNGVITEYRGQNYPKYDKAPILEYYYNEYNGYIGLTHTTPSFDEIVEMFNTLGYF